MYIYIYYITIYTQDIQSTKVTQNGFADVAFQVYTKCKRYNFVLLIWRCLGIGYRVDVISRSAVLGGKNINIHEQQNVYLSCPLSVQTLEW